MVPDPIQHVSLIEVPDDHRADHFGIHLLASRQKSARFRDCDLADATFVSLQVRVSVRVNRFDDDGTTLGPDEVHVTRVDHHAVLVRRVEANARTDAQVLRRGRF